MTHQRIKPDALKQAQRFEPESESDRESRLEHEQDDREDAAQEAADIEAEQSA